MQGLDTQGTTLKEHYWDRKQSSGYVAREYAVYVLETE